MEEIPLDTIEYDECEVVSSDEEYEEPQIEISISTNADWSIPPLNEEQMTELRNYVPSDSESESDSDSDSDDETSEVMGWYLRVLQSRTEDGYRPTRVIEIPIPREMPYYLPLKTLDQYDEIQARRRGRRQSNGVAYNRTFIG